MEIHTSAPLNLASADFAMRGRAAVTVNLKQGGDPSGALPAHVKHQSAGWERNRMGEAKSSIHRRVRRGCLTAAVTTPLAAAQPAGRRPSLNKHRSSSRLLALALLILEPAIPAGCDLPRER
jgi:hypothetical protein